MVYYKLIKVTINSLGLIKVIIDIKIRHHGLSDSIIIDYEFFFHLKILIISMLIL